MHLFFLLLSVCSQQKTEEKKTGKRKLVFTFVINWSFFFSQFHILNTNKVESLKKKVHLVCCQEVCWGMWTCIWKEKKVRNKTRPSSSQGILKEKKNAKFFIFILFMCQFFCLPTNPCKTKFFCLWFFYLLNVWRQKTLVMLKKKKTNLRNGWYNERPNKLVPKVQDYIFSCLNLLISPQSWRLQRMLKKKEVLNSKLRPPKKK
jgi:hypothetical protein